MTEDQLKEAIKEAVQKTSLDRLKSFSQQDNIEMTENNLDLESLSKKSLVVIIVAGEGIHQIFKIFFDPKESVQFLSTVFKTELNDEEAFDKSADFFKEVANLVAGHMKKLFNDAGLETEISLPILLRGYDSLFFEQQSGDKSFNSTWGLKHKNSSVICKVQCQLKNIDPKITFKYENSGGDIEFF